MKLQYPNDDGEWQTIEGVTVGPIEVKPPPDEQPILFMRTLTWHSPIPFPTTPANIDHLLGLEQ